MQEANVRQESSAEIVDLTMEEAAAVQGGGFAKTVKKLLSCLALGTGTTATRSGRR